MRFRNIAVDDPRSNADEPAGAAITAAIADAVARLVCGDPPPLVLRIALYLASHPRELILELGRADPMGVLLRQRDDLLRGLGLPPAPLAKALRRYRSDCWPRDRALARSPYRQDDRRNVFFQILKLVDRELGERQIRRILGHPPAGDVTAPAL
jgi:hypothetical protein